MRECVVQRPRGLVPDSDPRQPYVGPRDADSAMELRKMLEVDAVLGEFDHMHVNFAPVVLAATDELTVIDLRLGR